MKKVILFCGALLLVTAAVASAQLNIVATDCGGAGDASWICNNNKGGAFVACASVVMPAVQMLSGEQSVVEISFGAALNTPWWQFGGTYCRPGAALAVGFAAPVSGGCADYFGNVPKGPSGGASITQGPGLDSEGPVDANRLRIRVLSAVDVSSGPTQPAVGDEDFLFTITVSKANTLTCTGCQTPACVVFKKLVLTQAAPFDNLTLQSPNAYGYMTLQGGTGTDCPRATPVNSSSWGQLKSLYR